MADYKDVSPESPRSSEVVQTRAKGKSVAEDAATAANRFKLQRDVSVVTDLMELDINDTTDLETVFSGYLMKREGQVFHSWEIRYVCLCRGNAKRKMAGRVFMVYWNNHTKDFPRGRCEIFVGGSSGANSTTYDREYFDEGRRGYVFGYQPKDGARTRLFDCESDDVRQKWVAQLTAIGLTAKGIQTTPLVHASSIKEGWVNKCPKKGFGIWNRRFLTLTTTTCIYSSSRGDTHAQGMIMITPKTIFAICDKRPFSYRIVSDPSQPQNTHQGREFIFQCGDEQSFKSWMSAWQSVIKT